MRLESITKHFFAKSTMISDSPRATASDSLTGTDVMAALGLADLKSGFGLELFLAKQGISNPHRAVESLTQYALKESVKYKAMSKLDEDIKQSVVQTLARYAFADYARSAASVRECECCKGEGFIEADVFTMKSHYTMQLPQFAKDFGQSPSDFEVKRKVEETVRLLCKPCGGKGVVSNSCRCNGKGTVVDKEKSEQQGVPVYKTCGKCSGRGYSRLPSSEACAALEEFVGEIPETTWRRNFKPMYEALISKCHAEEGFADAQLHAVTR
ncbi:TPA: antitermination protein [Yersinia enterocolitica]|uniref:antitermination protein n=1 Tax=Yersinia enterocolitica TaxID=630 RepID=UPI0005E96013|nr:antitermination protein [Yersinia enterocolitica]EKN4832430.1 antitermination protein [Yersinia enterocolitica]EKN4854196.1 antitermination protein [Yersinia enterocolitica]ELW8175865.1 antitermination protein [Yersinia enterocolitica]CQH27826.1 antitermination protein [Yersinia enterocolitica]HDL6618019.1 antitermination protein [Yersinia enterocolitica]